jgi:proteasome alpha subunit
VTLPFYASAEQVMRDRSELARKGISRGRSVTVLTFSGGVLFVAENHSTALHKVSEIYDRIGFAAVGRYNEFENLRTAGIRAADVRGYSYDRRDVTGRWLANVYAQTMGAIFTEQQKPFEVELCVAEVGATSAADQLYRITYDGSISDETGFVVMGGQTEPISAKLPGRHGAGRRRRGRRARAAVRRRPGRLGRRRPGGQRGGRRPRAPGDRAGGRRAGPVAAAPGVPPDHRVRAGRAAAGGEPPAEEGRRKGR